MAKKYTPSPMSLEDFSKPHNLGDLFETRPCGRCGGSGSFSFNLLDGTRCYGCNGVGSKFTPRGKRQVAAYRAARSKAASEVKVGEKIKPQGCKSFAYPQDVKPSLSSYKSNGVNVPMIELVFSNMTIVTAATELVEVALSVEENYQNYIKALSA